MRDSEKHEKQPSSTYEAIKRTQKQAANNPLVLYRLVESGAAVRVAAPAAIRQPSQLTISRSTQGQDMCIP